MEGHATSARVTRAGAITVMIAVVGWAITNIIPKITQMSAVAFTLYRLWAGGILMVVVLGLTGRRVSRAMFRASALGGVLFGATVLLFFSALKLTSVADVLVIQALQPPLILMVAGPLFGERIGRFDVLWTLVSVGGVALVTVGTSGTPAWSLGGDILAVLSLVLWTGYILVSKRVRAGRGVAVPAVEYMTTVTLVAAVVVTPVALLSGDPLTGFRLADWGWLGLFLIAAQGGHVMLAWAHEHVDVSISSLLLLLQAPIAVVAAFVFLGEPVPPLSIVGGIVAMVAVASIVRRASRAGPAADLPAPDASPP